MKNKILIGFDHKRNSKVYIETKDRCKNILISGVAGSGKTRKLKDIIAQDIQNDCIQIILNEGNELKEFAFNIADENNKNITFIDAKSSNTYINPLIGDIDTVKTNIIDSFKLIYSDIPLFFMHLSSKLLAKSIIVIKKLYKDKANFLDLQKIIFNQNGEGEKILHDFLEKNHTSEDFNIAHWFYNEYFNNNNKISTHCSDAKAFIKQINDNKYLANIFNSESNVQHIDLNKEISNGGVIVINTDEELLKDDAIIFSTILENMIKSAIFKRKEKRDVYLYVDKKGSTIENLIELLISAKFLNVNAIALIQNIDDLSNNTKIILNKIFENEIICFNYKLEDNSNAKCFLVESGTTVFPVFLKI